MDRIKDRFTGGMYRRLFVPSLLSAFGLAFADMADALVVGQKMGATGLAAISLSLPVYMIINMFMHGFGAGGSVRYSKLLGEGKKKDAQNCFTRILRTSLFISIIMAVLGNIFLVPLLQILGTTPADGELFLASRDYVQIIVSGTPLFFLAYILNYFLRNDDNQKLASAAFITGNAVDILLNIVFVIVLDMGASGAAWSTLIGYAVSTICYLPGIISKKHSLKIKKASFNFKESFSCFGTGFSTSSQYLMQMLFFVIANNALMQMSGENGVAVFDMVQNASYLVVYLFDAAAKAAQPLVSTYFGEHNNEGRTNTLRLSLLCGCATGVTVAALLCIFPQYACALFGLHGQAIVELGKTALRIFCIGVVFSGVSIVLESYYQSCNREKSAFTLALLRGAIILIPTTILFSMFSTEYTFWWLFPITEVLSLLLALVIVRKFAKKDLSPERILSSIITNSNEDIGSLTAQVEKFCKKFNATPKQTYFVTMTIEEICLAIMMNAFDKTENGYIQMTLVACDDGLFELHIRDNATAFDPFSLCNKKGDDDLDIDIDAIGMMVIKNKAKDFFYRRYQGFNALVVRV